MAKPRVAVLGLGIMGGGMAGRLLSAGFPLSVYNRSRERSEPFSKAGALVGGSPREATAGAEIVISMVADDAASREVWLGENGALAGVSKRFILIESSTLSVDWVKELAAFAAQREVRTARRSGDGNEASRSIGRVVFHGGRLSRCAR